MGTIRYRVRSVLRAHWTRAVAVAVMVAAVGGLVLTLTAGVLRTISAPDRYGAAQGDTYDVALEQQGGRPRADEVAALPSVAAIETATFVFGGVIGNEEAEPVDGLTFAGSHRAFGARVTEGREPDQRRPGEFVATRSWRSEAGAQLAISSRC